MAELKLPFIGHGGDYNPDQWRDRPDILAEDIRLMKLARCNLMSVGIFAWATLEHFQRTRGVLRLMAAVMVKGKTKVRFELSGYEEPLNRIFHFLRYTVLTMVAPIVILVFRQFSGAIAVFCQVSSRVRQFQHPQRIEITGLCGFQGS